MAFTLLSFVVPFFSYYVLCNLSYDVTRWTWYCNKTENHAYLWIDLTKLAQSLLTYLVVIATDQFLGLLSKHEFFHFPSLQELFLVLNCPVALKIKQKRCQLVKSQKLLYNQLITNNDSEGRDLETNLLLWQPCLNHSNVQFG